MRTAFLLLGVLSVSAVTLRAQDRPVDSLAFRHFSLAAGAGNAFAGWGGTAEAYVARGRVSVVGGVGYVQRVDASDGRTSASAAIRGYSTGRRHRIFVEASYGPLTVGSPVTDLGVHYGPALAVGYSYTATSGFTFLISRGAGWSPSHSGLAATGNIGIGYTWRH